MRFSLSAFLIGLTLLSIGFFTWWRWPVLLDRLPPELGPEKIKGPYCRTGWDPSALWDEDWRQDSDPRIAASGHPVHAAVGKCWGRRDWNAGWILDGPAELFTKNNQRIIRAEFARGQLHGPFCSWYTTGEVRETGQYVRGAKHGVWKRSHPTRGEEREEYDHGKKTGLWDRGFEREHFCDDKLVKREHRSNLTAENWEISEFDADEKLQRVITWNADRTRQVGVELYLAGKRHGDWHAVRYVNDRPLTRRGQWAAGLPDGEWVYDRENGSPRRFEFQKGVLQKLDETPVNDWLMRRFVPQAQVAKKLEDALDTLKIIPGELRTRLDLLEQIPFYNWAPLYVDPRLKLTQEQLDSLLQTNLPSDFDCAGLPAAAAICLAFHEAGFCFDYRLGALWLTSPELAANWRDETGTQEWFHAISNAPDNYELDGKGQRQLIDGPFRQHEFHFGETNECNWAWQDKRVLELTHPLTCSLGTARRLDGRWPPGISLLKFPETVAENRLEWLPLDQRIPLECEIHHCRLVLRGEALVVESLSTAVNK